MTTSITLPAGPRKILLIDADAVKRNVSRSPGIAQPIARVLVLGDDGNATEVHVGDAVTVSGAVKSDYSQHGFIGTHGREQHRAAYTTTGKVVIESTDGAS